MDSTTSRWSGLAPDVFREVAGRLHDVGDFVRLHAVCKAWRSSHNAPPPLFRSTRTTQFPPWLIAGADKDPSTPLRFRCIFSKSSYRAPPPRLPESRRDWVGSTDATAVRYLTVEHLRAALHDLVTEEVTHLPQIPYCVDGQWDDKDNPHGTVYVDGTVLLYTISDVFRAALLRPGDTEWTLVERTLDIESPRRHGGFCAAYHRGRILVMEDSFWRIITPGVPVSGDELIQMPGNYYRSHSNYILVSRGELLWASVHDWISYNYRADSSVRALSVSVYALEEQAPGTTRWVRRDHHSLADRVFFLGSPNSFAMDASRLGNHGGCAYFIYCNKSKALAGENFGVFRYNLIDGNTEFVERLSPGWDNEKCTWLFPQPAIAPIQEITNRVRKAAKLKQKPCLRVMVRNLPLTVNSTQLQLLFSKYGKVSDAEVLYYKNTKRSQGIGLITMSAVHARPEDALEALNKLQLDGCRLEVILVKEGRRHRSIKAAELHVR